MLPNFECSMNIWDPKYSNCNVPENIMSNYTVNIAIHTPTYMREQAEFMYRLKMFIKNCNKGTFKQPMLGKLISIDSSAKSLHMEVARMSSRRKAHGLASIVEWIIILLLRPPPPID